jgi:hypothetical protein
MAGPIVRTDTSAECEAKASISFTKAADRRRVRGEPAPLSETIMLGRLRLVINAKRWTIRSYSFLNF